MNKLLKHPVFPGVLSALAIDANKDWQGKNITNINNIDANIATIGDGSNYSEFNSTGRLILHGNARIAKDLFMPAAGIRAPGTKPATYVDLGLNGAWEFSDGTDDTVGVFIYVPHEIDIAVQPCIRIKWSSPTADPGNDSKQAVWQVEYLWVALNEAVDGAAQETLSVTTSASIVANGLIKSCVTLVAPSVDDIGLVVRIKRLGADGADTLGDVAHVSGFNLHYISNKLGEIL